MTWAEFRIRSFGFKRVRNFQMFLTREISYENYVGRHIWAKSKPVTKSEYFPIDGFDNKKRVSKAIIDRLKEATEVYNKEKNG